MGYVSFRRTGIASVLVLTLFEMTVTVLADPPRMRREAGDERRAQALSASSHGQRARSSVAQVLSTRAVATGEDGTRMAGPVMDGVEWLKGNQNTSGSWGSVFEFVDTCTVVEALAEVDCDCAELANGALWLAGQSAANYEYLARQISALAEAGGFEVLVSDLTDELLAARNPAEWDTSLPNWPEGGWGLAEGYETDCLTTALALKALDAVGLNGGFAVNDEPLAAGATNTHEWDIPDDAVKVRIEITVAGSTVHLRMKEGSPPTQYDPYFIVPPGSWLIVFPDSGLPFTPGHNYITIQSTGSAATYTMTASYETATFDTRALAHPLAYLRESQNVDGGWGLQRGQPTEFYTTLHVLLTVLLYQNYDFSTELSDGITYLKSQQLGDGSFGYGGTPIAYVTALAALNLVGSETYPFSTETEDAITALLAMQEIDGSWDHEAYDTALAILALWDHNQTPTADAGSDQMVNDTDEDCLELVTLDGTGSTDVDGTIESYVWTENDVEIATGASPAVTLAVGTHILELTVTDDGGKTDSDTVTIDVVGTGVPSDVCHCCFPGGECQDLDATVCLDSGGSPAPGACAFEACCLADGGCHMRDPVCCEQEGGTPLAGETCSGDAACCFPGVDCTMLDPLCCALQGGDAHELGEVCTAPEACCLPGNACEQVDPLCCVDQGGVPQGEGTACTAPEACCLPDDTCETLDPLCCADQGGTSQGPGTTCTEPEACCLPDDSCQTLDPECCEDLDGLPQGAGTACTESEACCLPDDSCQTLDPECCENLDGLPQGVGTACTESEACCLPDDTCRTLDPECCENLAGLPQGGGTACTASEACCLPDDTCEMLDPLCCTDQGGVPQGVGTACTATEACCLADDTCQDFDPLCCASAGGAPQGMGSDCTASEACCLPDDTCEMMDPLCCVDNGGAPQGIDTSCTAPEACCLLDNTCELLDPLCCVDQGGAPRGAGSTCTELEACCLLDDTCQMLDPECCDNLDGLPQGMGTTCTALESCCLPGGGCEMLDPVCCDDAGGVPGFVSTCQGDGNENGVDDACEILSKRPAPWEFGEYGGSCEQDSDCWGATETAAYCVPAAEADQPAPGACYAPSNRYVSIARNPDQVENTARRITLQGGGAGPWWVGAPTYSPLEDTHFASVSPTSVYAGIGPGDWVDGDWPDVVHVKGCEIAPGYTYDIQAIQTGSDEGDELSYSEALALKSAPRWGDIVSTCIFDHCLPPTGAFTEPSIDDVLAVVNAFTGIRNAPLTWLDVDPVAFDGEPEGLWALIGDVLAVVNAFSGQSYPGNGPLGCTR